MSRTIKVRIDYEITLEDRAVIPPMEELEDRIKAQALTYGIGYGGNMSWYVDPAYVQVRAKKSWYESLFG